MERPNIPDWATVCVCTLPLNGGEIEELDGYLEEPEEPEELEELEELEERPLARRLLVYAVISLEDSGAEEAFARPGLACQTAYYH